MFVTLKHADDATVAAWRAEAAVRGTDEFFLLFAMGSQFDHLICQALEKIGVWCLVADPASFRAADVRRLAPKGVIISGGPASVHAEPPPFGRAVFDLGVPVLGICLGFQLWAAHVGLTVRAAARREFGVYPLQFADGAAASPLFHGCQDGAAVLESHGDQVAAGADLEVLAHTANAPVAAGRCRHLWGVQFHPEVSDSVDGPTLLANFCFRICGARAQPAASSAVDRKVAALAGVLDQRRVLLALSGGTDSSVVAYLFKAALSGRVGQVRSVYLKGIDRPDDEAHVLRHFGGDPGLDLRIVDGTEKFLDALAGQVTMPEKRLAVRAAYKRLLEDEAAAFGAELIAQGTLYTDLSESGGGYASGARKARIKLHHNVDLGFSLPELTPLADCVKDGARAVGRALGMPEELIYRHPFPGPGLAVRIEGEVTPARLAVARAADGIWIEELRRAALYGTVWQAGATVTGSVTTCTKGDDAADGLVVALWAVWSVNGFTAQAAELPYDFLKRVSARLTDEIREVGAVVYRLSGKPPTTIEWG